MWVEREGHQHRGASTRPGVDAEQGAARPVGAPGTRTAPHAMTPADVQRLQCVAGNGATARLLAPAPAVTVQRGREEEEEAARRIQAAFRGQRVREQLRVRREGRGIIGVRVRNTDPGALGDIRGTPLEQIRQPLRGENEYNHLRVTGGATRGAVLGPSEGQPGRRVSELAQGLPPGTAVINGGYFAHTDTIRSEEGWQPKPSTVPDPYWGAAYKHEELKPVGPQGRGRPVGPTSHRSDSLPVPSEYADHYGHVMIGGQVGLSSGPMLTDRGVPHALPPDERFRYRLPVGGERREDANPRNEQVGALTHAGDPNARSAISTQGNDVIMHTVTDPAMRVRSGATMDEWRRMTAAGASGEGGPVSTLNLDGGGSVYMGITTGDGVDVVAKGQRPTETVERPVGNIIASLPPENF